MLDSSKLKEFADDNFIFDEYGRKFSKWVENTVGKGEISRYEQFLFFPHSVSRIIVLQTRKTRACLEKGSMALKERRDIKYWSNYDISLTRLKKNCLNLSQTSPGFYVSSLQVF